MPVRGIGAGGGFSFDVFIIRMIRAGLDDGLHAVQRFQETAGCGVFGPGVGGFILVNERAQRVDRGLNIRAGRGLRFGRACVHERVASLTGVPSVKPI